MEDKINVVTTRSRKTPTIQWEGSSIERFNKQHSDDGPNLSKYSQTPLIRDPKDKPTLELNLSSINLSPTIAPNNTEVSLSTVVVNPPIPTQLPMLPASKFYPHPKIPIRNQRPKVKPSLSRSSRMMMFSKDLKPCDIMENLVKIQPTITMKQLLAVAPQCHSSLSSSMICRRSRPITVYDITLSQDPGVPTIDVIIGGALIPGF